MAIPFYYNPATNELELTADPSPLRDSLSKRFGLEEIFTARETLSPTKSYTEDRIDMKPGGLVEPGVTHYGIEDRLSDTEFKKLRNKFKNLSDEDFFKKLEAEGKLNSRGGKWKLPAVTAKTYALTDIRPREVTSLTDPKRLLSIKKYFDSYKKQHKVFPTPQESTNHFKKILGTDITQSITAAAKKYKIKLPSGLIGQKIKVDKDIKKLLSRKVIIDTLDSGKFPTESQIQAVLKGTRTQASTRAVDLAHYLTGENTFEPRSNFKAPTKYKKLAEIAIEEQGLFKEKQFGPRKARTRLYNERRLAKIFNIPGFTSLRQDILNKIYKIIPELKGLLSVDEIGSITAGARTNSPYTIFGQVLGQDFNKYVKSTAVDKSKSILEKNLIKLPKDSSERIVLQENYNKKVSDFETMANKNNPAKEVKGMKLSFEHPSKAIKNKKVYNRYKPLFDAHFEKYGYSFNIDKNTDAITDIAKKLDQPAFQKLIKNNFSKLIGKGGKTGALVALGTLAGTGWALADDKTLEPSDKKQEASVIGDVVSAVAENPIKSAAAVIGGDVALNKAKLSLKTLRGVDRALGPWMTPLIGLYTAITGESPDPTSAANLLIPSFWNSIMKRYNWQDKSADPIKKRIINAAKRGLIPTNLMPVISRVSGIGTAAFAAKYIAEESQPNIFRDDKGDLRMKDEQITTLPSNMIKDYHWRFESDDFFEKEYGIKKEDYKSELPEFLDLEKQKVRRQRPEPLDSYFMGGIASLIK